MNRLQHIAESAVNIAQAAPVILTAVTVATTEDIIRGVIAVVVVGAIVYQATLGGHAGAPVDPWLQSIASILIGYYFGLSTGIARTMTQQPAEPKAQSKK